MSGTGSQSSASGNRGILASPRGVRGSSRVTLQSSSPPSRTSAASSRRRRAGSLSQRLCPEGWGRGRSSRPRRGRRPHRRSGVRRTVRRPRRRGGSPAAAGRARARRRGAPGAGRGGGGPRRARGRRARPRRGSGRRSPEPSGRRPGKQVVVEVIHTRSRKSSSSRNPALSIQRTSSRPARPAKGRVTSCSTGPGAWPTRRMRCPGRPLKTGRAAAISPASAQRVQARWAATSSSRPRSRAALPRPDCRSPPVALRRFPAGPGSRGGV